MNNFSVMSDKQFSEKEIQEIIKRASRLQHTEDEAKKNVPNTLSIDEIIVAGKEAGLDVHNIKTAALEMREQKITRYSGLSDTHIFEERDINLPLDKQSAWDEIETELRHNFGGDNFGTTQSSSHNYKWSHMSLSGIETLASLSEKEGNYKLRLSQRVGMASSLTEGTMYGGMLAAVLASIITGVFSLGIVEGALMFAVFIVPLCVLVYTLDIAWRKKKLQRLKELADKISSQVQDTFNKPSILERNRPENTQIDIESLEERDISNNKDSLDNKIKN